MLYGGVLPFRLRMLTELVYGSSNVDEELWVAKYREHNERVQAVVPANQLLVLNIFEGDGWAQLCPFLGMTSGPCGDEAVEFPVLNKHAERHSRFQSRVPSVLPALHGPGTNKFAYASLLANPSSSDHRDYLLSFLVAAESIRQTGSTYDIVAMVYGVINEEDEQLLINEDIKLVRVGGVGAALGENFESFDEGAAKVFRAKLRVLQLVDYDMVLFFDADVVFLQNCDDLFETPLDFVGRAGLNSPFNAGMFLVRPSWQALVDITDVSLSQSFTPELGWFEYGAIPDWREEDRAITMDWSFYGASVDQGLVYYYYFCFRQGQNATLLPYNAYEERLVHFTGIHKPFNQRASARIPKKFQAASEYWRSLLAFIQTRTSQPLQRETVKVKAAVPRVRLSGKQVLPEGYPLLDAYPPPG